MPSSETFQLQPHWSVSHGHAPLQVPASAALGHPFSGRCLLTKTGYHSWGSVADWRYMEVRVGWQLCNGRVFVSAAESNRAAEKSNVRVDP